MELEDLVACIFAGNNFANIYDTKSQRGYVVSFCFLSIRSVSPPNSFFSLLKFSLIMQWSEFAGVHLLQQRVKFSLVLGLANMSGPWRWNSSTVMRISIVWDVSM